MGLRAARPSRGRLASFTSAVGNGADITEDVLQTFSLPASTLGSVGQAVRILASGTLANNANTKTVKAYFGAVVYSSGGVATANVNWAVELIVIKTGSNTQIVFGWMQLGATPIAVFHAAGAETDTGAITIKVTGQSSVATANTITCDAGTVESLS